ncbi:MAG: archaeosortase A [Candidatus Thermoplasmatota archaeon]|nr:archaeosortase A [Candidatus Thermoplasmatota archaeon]
MYLAFDILLWTGLLFLLIGYLKDYKKHEFRIIGFILLGLFWITLTPYYLKIRDYFNALMVVGALPVFLYFGYHEYLSKRWDEDPAVMEFLAGSVSFAMLLYFGIQRVPILSGFLIKVVADQTTWITTILGYNFHAGSINYSGNPLWYRTTSEFIRVPIVGTNINIILSCTGLQAIAAASALIWCTRASIGRKTKSLLILFPVVYIVNLLRNALVVYLVEEDMFSFAVAHNEIAKSLSVVVLIILMLVVFEILPELYENIISALGLPKRREKKESAEESDG